jgi:lipopolysaccharide/colanic/teichoic acid biosynthesis glycosyltransferase
MKNGSSSRYSFLKRVFDFTLALLGLALSFPLWFLFSIAIYLEDRKPVLFTQERYGKKGRQFYIYKFRTMRYNQEGRNVVIDLESDPRVTRVGRLLRSIALDELPTLVNILKGDMSFVGPRALPFEIEDGERTKYDNITQVPGYDLRSKVKPGLTGIAQIYAPKDVSRSTKFDYDKLYIERMSFWLDLKLVFLSFWITLRGKWEQRGTKV